jgi:hypothetical protein
LEIIRAAKATLALNSGGYWVRFLDVVSSFPKGSFRAYTTVQFLGSTTYWKRSSFHGSAELL